MSNIITGRHERAARYGEPKENKPPKIHAGHSGVRFPSNCRTEG
jgi:hypothetical protein